jgi:hypothetical protein
MEYCVHVVRESSLAFLLRISSSISLSLFFVFIQPASLSIQLQIQLSFSKPHPWMKLVPMLLPVTLAYTKIYLFSQRSTLQRKPVTRARVREIKVARRFALENEDFYELLETGTTGQ